jgi:hypothetical protein
METTTKYGVSTWLVLAILIILVTHLYVLDAIADEDPDNKQKKLIQCIDKAMEQFQKGDINFNDLNTVSQCFDQYFDSEKDKADNNNNNSTLPLQSV